MVRVRGVAVGVAVVVMVAGVAGCDGGGGKGGQSGAAAKPAAEAPQPLVITQAEAEKVFSRYEWERRSSMGWKESEGIAKVVTGPLMAERKADAALRAIQGDLQGAVAGLVNPAFAIPAERDQPSYPRSFAVFSKANGREDGPATAVHYFVQEAPGGEWKAAVETWVATAASVPLEAGDVSPFAGLAVQLRKTPVAAVSRDAAGAAVLSPTAEADRGACGRFADYLSFTTTDAEPQSAEFAQGPLTAGAIGELKAKAEHPGLKGLVRYTYKHEVTGPQLPVLKLDNGTSLVACTLLRSEHVEGKAGTVSFTFDEDSGHSTLLDAKGKRWRSSDAKLSLTAVIEVPAAGGPGQAEVAACNCRRPQLLEATGKIAD
ncbi:hypothetical protein ACLF6K_39555 (plasmid) [Streptomyces xanthophaeus]|uniref:hypothetical protein n=1 Tax=Streptomyces xanthophaeus TaxID=67385 RepID=UPI00398F8FC8